MRSHRLLLLSWRGLAAVRRPGDAVPIHPVSGAGDLRRQAGRRGEGVPGSPTSAPMVPQIPQNPHGVTGRDGRFTLTTFKDGRRRRRRAATRSSCSGRRRSDGRGGGHAGPAPRLVHGVHSKLTAQIKAGPNELPPFTVPTIKGPPGKIQGIPGRN